MKAPAGGFWPSRFMNNIEDTGEDLCAIYVDMGTTNTRAWLMRGSEVVALANKPVGAGDTARDGSPVRIHEALREVITTVRTRANDSLDACVPACVAAAGMITSSLGLAKLPHVSAPAGIQELAASSRWFEFPQITDLSFLLIPGVRSGPAQKSVDLLHRVDVMRGEETLCAGLNVLKLARRPKVLLNLGSHWKAIQLEDGGRIESSITSLSGELIHAAQTQTILASAVLKERPTRIVERWLEAGMKEQRRSGLPRALFCVRLLELANECTPEDRLSFLIGAFVASDLDRLVARKLLVAGHQVVIAGAAPLAEAWSGALARISIPAVVLSAAEVEKALLAGFRYILRRSFQLRGSGGKSQLSEPVIRWINQEI
jgi:2-dehydro-3-deoxygalactonokinase